MGLQAVEAVPRTHPIPFWGLWSGYFFLPELFLAVDFFEELEEPELLFFLLLEAFLVAISNLRKSRNGTTAEAIARDSGLVAKHCQ